MKATFTSDSLRQVKIKVYVNADRRGLFHGWYHENTTDRNGRQNTNLYGIIEMSDGNIVLAKSSDFSFLDSAAHFDGLYWSEDANKFT